MVEREEGAGVVETPRPVIVANWVRRRRNARAIAAAGVPGFIGGQKESRSKYSRSIGRMELPGVYQACSL